MVEYRRLPPAAGAFMPVRAKQASTRAAPSSARGDIADGEAIPFRALPSLSVRRAVECRRGKPTDLLIITGAARHRFPPTD